MKSLLGQGTGTLVRYAGLAEGILLFSSALFIYLANGEPISSNDSVPSSLLAFNWLENHTLHFDAFRGGHYYMPNDIFGQNGIPYFFTESPSGHLTSAYPIGTALLSFPLYALFFLSIKFSALIQHQPLLLDIVDPSFEPQRQFYEKLAGATLAAFTNVVFYGLARLKFNRSVSLLLTFIYGFATLNWVISSQGLWAHTLSNLALVCMMLCLWKANRLTDENSRNRRRIMLVTAGFFSGLLPAIRPTGLLFLAAILVYVVFTYRKESLFFLLGGLSFFLNSAWNIYYFGLSLRTLIVGGYSSLFKHSSSYTWTLSYFNTAFWGYLISPSRGLLIFSPVLLFAIPGWYQVYKRRAQVDERLLILLGITCLVLFLQYCFYVPWWGAITYGSRFLVDFFPVLCYPIGYVLVTLWASLQQNRKRVSILLLSVFVSLTVYSTFVQVVGAFSDRNIWDTSPYFSPDRFWDWQDNQISRHTKNLLLKFNEPISHPKIYRRQLEGTIEKIQTGSGQEIPDVLTVRPSQDLLLQAQIKNIGKAQWFGYDTGLRHGRAIVKVEFFRERQRVPISTLNFLYVKGTPHPGETASAIGSVLFPQEPGTYRMVFSMGLERMGNFPPDTRPIEFQAQVTSNPLHP